MKTANKLKLALNILKSRQPNTPGLGAAIHLIEEAIADLQKKVILNEKQLRK